VSIYLGESGHVEIQRATDGGGNLASVLDPGDVTASGKRFSFDFPPNALITGDHIEIATQDGSILELVSGHAYPDGYWYCHIDDAGGIRLYSTFEAAVAGNVNDALPLDTPTHPQPIVVTVKDTTYNCVAQMRDWSLTTSREAVDLTTLGSEFRQSYSNGLISGQGQLNCLWDFRHQFCDPATAGTTELPHYFAQLVLRVRQGSLFKGRFFLHVSATRKDVWYEADCIVTSVGFRFAPGATVDSTVEFITTGEVKLLVGELPARLLQESSSLILAEDGSPVLLEEPD